MSPQIFDVDAVLKRAKAILVKVGIKDEVLKADLRKELEIKCSNIKIIAPAVPPKVIYNSAVSVVDNRGYSGKKEVSYNGKALRFTPIAIEAIKQEFEPPPILPKILTYP
jgi:hypothetical protein